MKQVLRRQIGLLLERSRTISCRDILAILVLGAAATVAAAGPIGVLADNTTRNTEEVTTMAQHGFVGMWVTADGYIRHELLPNGRYDEQRGSRKSAYQGRYTITGNHIDYVDNSGFTADGEFIDGVLHHAGMILYRET